MKLVLLILYSLLTPTDYLIAYPFSSTLCKVKPYKLYECQPLKDFRPSTNSPQAYGLLRICLGPCALARHQEVETPGLKVRYSLNREHGMLCLLLPFVGYFLLVFQYISIYYW